MNVWESIGICVVVFTSSVGTVVIFGLAYCKLRELLKPAPTEDEYASRVITKGVGR